VGERRARGDGAVLDYVVDEGIHGAGHDTAALSVFPGGTPGPRNAVLNTMGRERLRGRAI